MTGTRSLGIAGDGVFLAEARQTTGSGSTTAAARETSISGNGSDGVHFVYSGTNGNVVAGDYDRHGCLGFEEPGQRRQRRSDLGRGHQQPRGARPPVRGNVISGNGRSAYTSTIGGPPAISWRPTSIGTDAQEPSPLATQRWSDHARRCGQYDRRDGGRAERHLGQRNGVTGLGQSATTGDRRSREIYIGTDVTGTQSPGQRQRRCG